jgi:hypothetical protein
MQWRENRKNQIHLKNPLALPASVNILTPTRPAVHGKTNLKL